MGRGRSRSGGTAATVALTAAGIAFELHAYEHDPRVTSFGDEAADALGVPPERVFKTLLAALEPPGGAGRAELVVGIVPVVGLLDLKALARAVGGGRATMADVAAAERATGYVAGGISPVGQKRRHRTVLDDSALRHTSIFVSGGRRGLDLELAPQSLLAVTGALTATIAR